MAFGFVICTYCSKKFLKDNRHINENIKLGNNFYCSAKCQYTFKNKQINFKCENPTCTNTFKRAPNDISPHNFCSRSCAATINNKKFPKKIKKIIKMNCRFCKKIMFKKQKYCSVNCRIKVNAITEEKIVNRIRNFYSNTGRIPLKREMWGIYKPARKYFGTWNKAIEAAGFKPNPVMFADRCVANDGHVCDSIAEKIIDDYLYKKGITHERNISYPEGTYTADFKIGAKLIEYFGLEGEHQKYDEIRVIKQKLIRKYKLHLIEIYPKDLYSETRLRAILGY